MEMNPAARISQIGDQTGIGKARRTAVAMAAAHGFGETDSGKLAIAVTEAAANILKHAQDGEILLRPTGRGIEMLAIDKGPGIDDLGEALRDGLSTVGTTGIGLGAIARLASVFDVYSGRGLGTVMAAEFYPAGVSEESNGSLEGLLEIGVAQTPYPGEEVCGDAWARRGNCLFVVDGLGHGFPAAQAAEVAVNAFEDNWRRPVRDAVEAVHLALRATRGAAVAMAEADPDLRKVRFCGLGNISGSIVSDARGRGMVSHNGTAGHEVHRIDQFEYAWPEDALIVLHSDGISAKWDLEAYPGLAMRRPSLIAAVLYRDFRRLKDDATVIVARARPARRDA